MPNLELGGRGIEYGSRMRAIADGCTNSVGSNPAPPLKFADSFRRGLGIVMDHDCETLKWCTICHETTHQEKLPEGHLECKKCGAHYWPKKPLDRSEKIENADQSRIYSITGSGICGG